MHRSVSYFTFVALLMTGCAHQERPASAPAGTAAEAPKTARAAVVPVAVSNTLITTFGHHTIGRTWTVRVSEEDRTVEVTSTRLFEDGSSATTSKPSGWRAQPGWFVLVENEQRVWAYDGDRDLLLFDETGTPERKVSTLSGPTKFACPVPEAVLTRLSDAARKAIKKNE